MAPGTSFGWFSTKRYMVAVLAVTVVLVLRYVLSLFVETNPPFLLFAVAVAFAGWHGGLGPGLLATLLGAIAGIVLYIEPQRSGGMLSSADWVRLIYYLGLSCVISLLNHSLHGSLARFRHLARLHAFGEARQQLILESSRDFAIVSMDAAGRITGWNTGAEVIFRRPREEAMGRSAHFMFTPDDVKAGVPEQELETARTTGRAEDDRWQIRGDGEEFWASGVVVPIRPDNILEGYVKILRDRTEQRQKEETLLDSHDTLAQQASELARSNLELEQFASIISHDLRTPLMSISGAAHILRDRCPDDPETGELLSMISTSVDHMGRLIGNLLHYARAGASELRKTRFDAGEVVARVVQTMQPRLEEEGAVVEVAPLPVIEADETLLAQVFQNLIENAVKYRREPPPRVEIRAAERPGEWVFSVEDNGAGIPPEQHGWIFERFHRLGGKAEGTGIGLATVRQILERHGGRIWLDSQVGAGTTFHLALPR